MNNISSNHSATHSLRKQALCLASAATLALLAFALPAAASDARPTHAAVAKAQENCAMHKEHVHRLEAKGASEAELSQARSNWEDSCEKAEVLMQAAGID